MTRTTMITATFFVCLTLSSCVTPNEVRVEGRSRDEVNSRSDCPPLPSLSRDATVFEKRVWEMTVIELYRQCAESKK